MKKLSCIILAVMLITAMFVSCTAEVIDDSNLVNVRFTTDDNAKGLNWSRPAFDSSDYYWTYYAKKVGGGPATGEGSGTIGADLTKEIGPFSQGAWEFTLYGYSNESKKTLVYEGTGSGVLSREKNNSVKVAVEAKKEGEGTIHVSKDIVLKDSNGVSYVPTGIIVKQVDSETVVREAEFNSANGNDIYGLKSGYYAVTIQMVATVNGEEIVYASNTIYVNVYDGQTTTIGGTLDESTTSTKFEAEDGTISDNKEGEVNEDGSASFTVDVSPSNVESDKTIVEFPEGALEASKTAKLSVAAYPTSVITKTFGVSKDDAAPIFGIDLQLTVDGAEVKEFNGKAVTITTFVAKNLTSSVVESQDDAEAEGLKVVYNGGGDQPAIVSYDPANGRLVFTTTHFSQYYVASTKIVAVNTTTNAAYTSLQDAIDAVAEGATIAVIKDIDPVYTIVVKDKTLTLDLNGKTIANTSELWGKEDSENGICWSLVSVRGTGDLTIAGNGALLAKENDCYPVDVQDGATLTIENGTFVGNIHAVYVEKGTANIKGGRYSVQQKYPDEAKAYGFVLNLLDENRKNGTAKMIVTGGEFKNFNPQDCWAEGEHTNFLPKEGGYGATYDPDNGVFVVAKFEEENVNDYDSLAKALNAGKLAVLQNDILLSDSVTIEGGRAALNLNGKRISIIVDKPALIAKGSSLVIYGDDESEVEATGTVVSAIKNGSVIINGGKFYSSLYNHGAICAGGGSNASDVTIGTVIINRAKVEAQEAALVALYNSLLIVNDGSFTTKDNFVVGSNGSSYLSSGSYQILINGGVFNGNIQSTGYIACGIYACNSGKVTLNGGEFNIKDGVGIVARSGELFVGKKVRINLTLTGKIEAGKVGDSQIKIKSDTHIVHDEKSDYPAGSPTITNNSNYKIVDVDGNEIQN